MELSWFDLQIGIRNKTYAFDITCSNVVFSVALPRLLPEADIVESTTSSNKISTIY